MVAVAPGVQDLHADFATLGMYRLGHFLVLRNMGAVRHAGGEGADPALAVRRNSPRDYEADAAPRPLGEVGSQALETVFRLLQARVHAAHEHPVGQGGEAEVEGGEEVGEIHEIGN